MSGVGTVTLHGSVTSFAAARGRQTQSTPIVSLCCRVRQGLWKRVVESGGKDVCTFGDIQYLITMVATHSAPVCASSVQRRKSPWISSSRVIAVWLFWLIDDKVREVDDNPSEVMFGESSESNMSHDEVCSIVGWCWRSPLPGGRY
jgi:hypothetical protein